MNKLALNTSEIGRAVSSRRRDNPVYTSAGGLFANHLPTNQYYFPAYKALV